MFRRKDQSFPILKFSRSNNYNQIDHMNFNSAFVSINATNISNHFEQFVYVVCFLQHFSATSQGSSYCIKHHDMPLRRLVVLTKVFVIHCKGKEAVYVTTFFV